MILKISRFLARVILPLSFFFSTTALALPAHNAYPRWSPDGTQIVFHSSRDGNFEIYVMDSDGKNQRRLTHHIASDRQPRWSPDGHNIVFQSDRESLGFHGEMTTEIYSMKASGGEPVRLTNNRIPDTVPAYSSDGNKILFISGIREQATLKVLDLETGESKPIKLDKDSQALLHGNIGNPRWLPDDKHVLVDGQAGGQKHDLIMIDILSGKATDITEDKIQSFYPSPSPDGHYIAFGGSISTSGDEQWDIFSMTRDDKKIKRLTNNPEYEGWPEWSPDGKKVAFSRLVDGTIEIFVMSHDGSNQIQITGEPRDSATYFNHPAWSPDGLYVAYDVEIGGQDSEIFIASIDGSAVRRITFNDAKDSHPYWSPDGYHLAYESNRDGDFEIFVTNLLTGEEKQITENDTPDLLPTWHPGGKSLVYKSINKDGSGIQFVNLASGETISLLNNSSNNSEPVFSHDGKVLAFRSNINGTNHIYVRENDGAIKQISKQFSNGSEPWWIPNTPALVFFTSTSDGTKYVTYNLATGKSHDLTKIFVGFGIPSFSPDGRRFLFMRPDGNGRSIFVYDIDQGEAKKLDLTSSIQK